MLSKSHKLDISVIFWKCTQVKAAPLKSAGAKNPVYFKRKHFASNSIILFSITFGKVQLCSEHLSFEISNKSLNLLSTIFNVKLCKYARTYIFTFVYVHTFFLAWTLTLILSKWKSKYNTMYMKSWQNHVQTLIFWRKYLVHT